MECFGDGGLVAAAGGGHMKLERESVAAFDRDGFVMVRGFIPAAMVARMAAGYDRAVRGEIEVPAWKDKLGPGRPLQLGEVAKNIPEIGSSGHLSLIEEAAAQLMGRRMVFWYDQLILEPAHQPVTTPWHQDAGYWGGKEGESGVTCWLALAPVTRAQGSMQFIPGSHKQGMLDHHSAADKSPIRGALEVTVDASKAVCTDYQPGDATFHHARTLHFTDGNATDLPRKGLVTHLQQSDI
jgi:hypothetical protein